ncbi:hypothetical protein JOC85_000023 [Bacillus mesophilus]|uniref:DUF4440 domain-containing protein n=1 Tax=Bacillus mesophilus TaxID=1808955 RepID=A0A6M0Q3T7_9BACI|nr:DUF4440 domain-containing protein [Bacillus mesophilus]MBM7659256.1 hypothetical protein [Bacillus mesophilus]NEY70130.1 DUF4440 domain-containing protein [Bacillus mesophilus]
MEHNLKELIKELEEKHTNINVRKCREELNQILADEFFEIGSSGFMYDKKECLEGGVVLTEMTIHNHEVYPLSLDVVLSTYFVEDKSRNRNTLRSSIWKFIDGKWQLYFHQGTITSQTVTDLKK